jgi:hypothetical protein
MWIRSRVTDFSSYEIEHGRGALRVDVLFIVSSRQFLFVFVPDHLEEVDVSIQGFVLVQP